MLLGRKLAIYQDLFVVWNAYIITTKTTNALQLHLPCRGELELIAHGRQRLLFFSKSPSISIPVLTFIDAFGLYSTTVSSE